MSEKTTDTPKRGESNLSRLILFGGVIILVVSVCLLFAGAFIAQQDRGYESTSTENSTSQDPKPTTAIGEQRDEVNASSTTTNVSLSNGDPPTSSGNQAAKKSKSALSDPSIMWEHIDEESVDESDLPKFPREITNRALVRMNASVWTTTEGYRVQFPIPQRDIILVGEVSAIGGTPLAPTLKGQVNDLGENYPFTLTLSKEQAFATVSSSTGNYELFANRDFGWVMAAEDMDDHVDYSIPHTFIENPDPHSGIEHLPH